MKQTDFEFKRAVFGGFDRSDVSRYIARLASERNELSEKCAALSALCDEQRRENEELSEKLAAAEKALSISEKSCETLGSEFALETELALDDFLQKCASAASGQNEILERISGGFSEIRSAQDKVLTAADELRGELLSLCNACAPAENGGADENINEKAGENDAE